MKKMSHLKKYYKYFNQMEEYATKNPLSAEFLSNLNEKKSPHNKFAEWLDINRWCCIPDVCKIFYATGNNKKFLYYENADTAEIEWKFLLKVITRFNFDMSGRVEFLFAPHKQNVWIKR